MVIRLASWPSLSIVQIRGFFIQIITFNSIFYISQIIEPIDKKIKRSIVS